MNETSIALTEIEFDILLQALSIAEDEAGTWVDPDGKLYAKLQLKKDSFKNV
jgi:LEA14-like dessication related protein